eukprot:205468_1
MSIFCCLMFIWLNVHLTYSSCQYSLPCKWTVDNHTLDLTAFQIIGLNLTGQDIEYTYELTLCNNLFPNTQMVQQTKINDPSKVNYLARYSKFVMPSIQLDSNSAIKSWYFDYSQNLSLQFICDYHQPLTSYMEIVQILEIVPYKYLIQVSSLYACENVIAPYNLSYDQCIWYDEATSSTLDLRPLYGRVISNYDSAYEYTVCQDAFYRYSQCGMWGKEYVADGSWTFSYGARHDNIIKWVCDRTIDTYKVLSYSGYLEIASQFACTAPVDCVFIDPDNNENVLDLRDLQGQLYQIINNDFAYSYQYTPCTNFLTCNSKESVMAMRWNIAQRECDPYLAVYDGFNGYTLFYNESATQWGFTYNNGDLCPDEQFPNVELNIYWTCNQTTTNAYITKVDTTNACNYSMYIESSYAC